MVKTTAELADLVTGERLNVEVAGNSVRMNRDNDNTELGFLKLTTNKSA